jgi:pimeloyl-ACP methyl ester carboxylesterase
VSTAGDALAIELPDGRRLAYAEWGDPAGPPLLEFHGTPGCRLVVWGEPPAPEAVRVRLITVDRPGIGQSDPNPGRSVVDWADDVAALADALGLGRFAVVGHSVGAAYAAACAARLPERVRRLGLVSPIVPLDRPGALAELGKPHQWAAARRAPLALRAGYRAAAALALTSPSLAARVLSVGMSAPERSLMRSPALLARSRGIARESVRGGAGGLVEDLRVAMRPWGFRPEEIGVATWAWLGDADSSIPGSWGDYYAAAIPDCRLVRCPGEGHLLFEDRAREIFATLTEEESPTG